MPQCINSCLSDVGIAIKKCNEMLQTPAISSCNLRTAMWTQVVPLTVDLFHTYWKKVSDRPMFDLINAEFCKWDYVQKSIQIGQDTYTDRPEISYPVKCIGMRHRKTNEPHGIVRGITCTGTITEACWVHGKCYGFVRSIF